MYYTVNIFTRLVGDSHQVQFAQESTAERLRVFDLLLAKYSEFSDQVVASKERWPGDFLHFTRTFFVYSTFVKFLRALCGQMSESVSQ